MGEWRRCWPSVAEAFEARRLAGAGEGGQGAQGGDRGGDAVRTRRPAAPAAETTETLSRAPVARPALQ